MKSINEYICDALENLPIFEMAYSRKQYKDTIRGLCGQIVENWCLIRYCTLTNRNETKDHWIKELWSHLDNIWRMNIKLDKTKCLQEELIYNPEHNNPNEVYKWIKRKFDWENIKDIDNIKQVALDYAEYGVEEIIDILANKKDIEEYLKTI